MSDGLVRLTAEIVSSYLEANRLEADELGPVVRSTLAALRALGPSAIAPPEVVAKPTAAQIRRSITADALISFLDGRPYRVLKRHLRNHGLTPEDYRRRFGLPADYPLTAPSYSKFRSDLAISLGLGRNAD